MRTTSIRTLSIVSTLSIFIHAVTGSNMMRCYCNLPECLLDSGAGQYSCKSRVGCFQELPHSNLPQQQQLYASNARANNAPSVPHMERVFTEELRYGCLELWPSDSTPFQCTEPGIRKFPAGSNRRHVSGPLTDDLGDEIEQTARNGRMKNTDRLAISRRRPFSNRHNQNKIFESRRWSGSYDVPLRCCTGDWCNRHRRLIDNSASKFSDYIVGSSTVVTAFAKAGNISRQNDSPSSSTSTTTVLAASHTNWWYTSTMIFVPIIGGITFFLLVAVGCWILHFGSENPCRCCKSGKNFTTVAIPYYFYDTAATSPVATKLMDGDSAAGHDDSTKAFKCLVVETQTEFSNGKTGGRCVHVPIFLSKYYGHCVVSVKPANARTFFR